MAERLYWGDLHNHCAVGYAKGSLERAYAIARSHLDVFAFTGHAQWHDMPEMPGQRHLKWVDGCRVHSEQWPLVQRLAHEHNLPGQFVAFLAYEWHSSEFGDWCVYYPGDEGPLRHCGHVRELQAHARETGALLLPHHPAYRQGWRGLNPRWIDAELTPTIEIFSEHGNAESDRGRYDYWRHSNGPRSTVNTYEQLLRDGHRLGVTAGTDDHLGYPGAYDEGLTGFWANSLTREGIWQAICSRRVYGVTGDRIELDFAVNDVPMGGTMARCSRRVVQVRVKAPDRIDRVELLRGNRVISRHFPSDLRADTWQGHGHLRIEFGWGPWGALDLERVCDWRAAVTLSGGELRRVLPCFQSGPFDEERRNQITGWNSREAHWISYTSRREAIGERATNGVILELTGGPETVIHLDLSEPVALSARTTISELMRTNLIEFTGGFTSESLVICRPVPIELSTATFEAVDYTPVDEPTWYRVRVVQENGQMAWSSPVWVG